MFQLIEEFHIKSKTVTVSARKKMRAFFVPLILSEGIFFNICVLSQCIVCIEYTFRISISKNITSYTFLLVFKVAESLQCILKIKKLLTS